VLVAALVVGHCSLSLVGRKSRATGMPVGLERV
jgi:hypothetical protein